MSWSERLEENRKMQDRQSCSPAKPPKGTFDPFAGEQKEQIPEFSRMPSRAELERICRRAVSNYTNVDADPLRRFLEIAGDPVWCSEIWARRLAKRMADGMIR